MGASLQQEETPLDEEIAKELVAITPEFWSSILLEVTFYADGAMEHYAHVISSPALSEITLAFAEV